MLSITIQDIKKLEPNILDFGVDSFDDEMTEAAEEVTRDIRIKWWPTSAIGRYDISILGTAQAEMNADLLTNSQWTKCVALYCLGYMIFPKLSTFNSEQDMVPFYIGDEPIWDGEAGIEGKHLLVVATGIGMVLLHQLAVSRLDLSIAGGAADTEHGIGIAHS